MIKRVIPMVLLALATTGLAQAGTVSYRAVAAETDTDWQETLSVAKFDASLGTLTQVVFRYGGGLWSDFVVENRSRSSGTTITADLLGQIVFGLPIGGMVDLTLRNAFSRTLGAYDGVLDFGGASGYSFAPQTTVGEDMKAFTSGLEAFVGSGTIDIAATATGFVEYFGGGNLIAGAQTRASAWVEVVYEYAQAERQQVPEPASVLLLGAGLLGLGWGGRRRPART